MTVYKGIYINAMYQRTLAMHNVTIDYTDLMTEHEAHIWRGLHEVHQGSIRSSFVLLLIKHGKDRQIVPSIKLNDDSISIY